MISFGISQINFQDDSIETLSYGEIVVLVGPNNAGKSALLREIYEATMGQSSQVPHRWVRNIQTQRDGSRSDFNNWFSSFARIIPQHYPNGGSLGFWDEGHSGNPLAIDHAEEMWTTGRDLSSLKRRLIGYYPAMYREQLLGAPSIRNVMIPSSHPMHDLWDDPTLEYKLSEIVQRAFGFPISINRYSQNLNILQGKPTRPNEPLPPSRELLLEYAALAPISEQGDGIKSFTGLALHAIAGRLLVTFIDEPEAFLHPPQARLIGRLLASETPQNGQTLIATHSSDVLEGILDGAPNRPVKIIRVGSTRETAHRTRSVLPPERVARLWKDPLLRYSRLLAGLFHKGTVICEADSDCRFYTATLDTFLKNETEHDLLFTHVGGKGRLAQAAAEMSAFNVPVAVIGDIDVLRQRDQIDGIIRALGDNPDSYQDDLATIRRDADSRSSAPLAASLKEALKPIMRLPDNHRLGEIEIIGLSESIRLRSGWKDIKRAGIAAFEGESYQAASRVIDRLSEIGLFIVPVGELERWYPELSAGHGPGFVSTLLERGYHDRLTPELSSFLSKLAKYFHLT